MKGEDRVPATPLKLAFLGCGSAARAHSKTLGRLRDHARCAYASRDGLRAEEYCRRYGGFRHYASYERALEDPEIEAVLVTTPPQSHLQLTLAALAAGKHVIVEKPAFLKASDVDQVQVEATAQRRSVFVAENYCYKPVVAELRRSLEDGLIGDILFVYVNALKEQKVTGWRNDAVLAGGGALFEGGIHWLNFLSNLGLKVEAVQGYQVGARSELERSMLVLLRFGGGAVGTLAYSWEVPSLFRGLRVSRIFGTRGSITFETNGLFVLARGSKTRLRVPDLSDISGSRAMFEDFFAALRTDRPPRMTLSDARRDLLFVEQAYASAFDTGAPHSRPDIRRGGSAELHELIRPSR